ncbi:MAG: outer membrane protein assembly factor BamD [Flavobacteriales bacterium]|nr:outer membrane protein assembly factor BamD [Flavobacteriales bacterium]
MNLRIQHILFVIMVLFLASCSDYNKILKGNDYELKYSKAVELYNEGDCYRALPLFDELMTYYRMTDKGEDVYYYYANTHYCLKDYYMASYYFKRFTKHFPTSPRKEECAFMSAICTMKNSPEYNLDPTDTRKAIDELQLFMDQYPESSKMDTCNALIEQLRGKLERKSYEQGKLYYKMEKYQSAIITFGTTLKSYPDTEYKEEIMYLMVRSSYLLAENSVEAKKMERYQETIKHYRIFADYFPQSEYLKNAQGYHDASLKEIEKLNNAN